jgi:hypothetical protein
VASCRVLVGNSENLIDAAPAEFEDLLHVATYFNSLGDLAEDAEGKRVAGDIAHSCTAAVRFERVGVMPEAIRSRDLYVGEGMRRIPFANFGSPLQRNMMPGEAVANLGASHYGFGAHREHPESQPGRRDGFKIPSVREEREDVFNGARDPLLLAQSVEAETHIGCCSIGNAAPLNRRA